MASTTDTVSPSVAPPADEQDEELIDEELLVEEISIDGMCGVY
jgi:mycofactocin precursor